MGGIKPVPLSPADRWEALVRSGMSEATATAMVRREMVGRPSLLGRAAAALTTPAPVPEPTGIEATLRAASQAPMAGRQAVMAKARESLRPTLGSTAANLFLNNVPALVAPRAAAQMDERALDEAARAGVDVSKHAGLLGVAAAGGDVTGNLLLNKAIPNVGALKPGMTAGQVGKSLVAGGAVDYGVGAGLTKIAGGTNEDANRAGLLQAGLGTAFRGLAGAPVVRDAFKPHLPSIGNERGVLGSAPKGEGEGFVYHTTSRDNLADIASSGLKPRRPSFRGEQEYWPKSMGGPGNEGRVYFGPTQESVVPFSEPGHVTVRVNRAYAEKVGLLEEFRGSDMFTRKQIPARYIEVLEGDKWVPLKSPETGTGAVPIMSGVTGGVVGGSVGYASGDTPEQKRERALMGFLAGAGAGAGIGVAAERVGPKAKDWASRTYQQVLNDTHAADEFGRIVGKTEDVADAAATARGWRGRAEWYVGKRGAPVGGPITLRQVMLSAKGIEDEVTQLAQYRHALELDAAGMENKGIDIAAARAAIPQLEADPRVKAAADELHGFYRRLLDERYANGLLDKDQYEAILSRGENYVPFVRDWQVAESTPSTQGGRLFNRGSGVRRMDPKQKATSPIVNPFEQAVRDAQSTARDIARQRVMNVVGDIMAAHPTESAPFLIDHGPVKGGVPLPPSASDRIIEPVINGVRHRVEVTDPDLLQALESATPVGQSLLKQMLTLPKRMLQTGVTMVPEFGVANATRDAFFSSLQYKFPVAQAAAGGIVGAGVGAAVSEPGERLKGAGAGLALGVSAGVMRKHAGRIGAGLGHVLKYDDLYQQWLKEGGSGMGFYASTPQEARRLVASLTKQHGPLDILNPKSWWDGLKFVNEAIEQAPRVARFAERMDAGQSPMAAAASSRDISVDFGRHGADPGVRTAGEVTAFWNPKIQGLDKVRRTLFGKGSAKAWGMGVATMTGPSLALFYINKDDKSYWDRPLWERNLFWLVPAGKLENGDTRFIRVPKPFEPGLIFASLPERLAEFAYQRDPERTAEALRGMVSGTADGLLPIPTGIKPFAEAAVNYDTFRDRPVVPQGMQKMSPAMQSLPRSSVLARGVAAIGEAVPGIPTIAPVVTDHVVRGIGGPLAAEGLEMVADPLARMAGLDRGPVLPARPLVEWSRFVTKPNGFGTDDVQVMFRRFDQAESRYRDIEAKAKSGSPDLQEYIAKHREDIMVYEQLKPFAQSFRDLSATRRAVEANRILTAEQKRAEILRLGAAASEIASKAVNSLTQ